MDGGATLPRPMKKLSSPTLPGPIMKPRTVIYMEKSAQTEMSHKDVREGQEACQKLRSLSWQQQNNEEARQLERMLMQVFCQICCLKKNTFTKHDFCKFNNRAKMKLKCYNKNWTKNARSDRLFKGNWKKQLNG
jgi:hypothetical protein